MTAQRIVKLVPIGQPEDNMFAEVIIGGTDDLSALADFVGWHLEYFTGLTTDGSGQVTVTLAHAPTDLAHCWLMSHEDERVLSVAGLAFSTHLTVQKRKLVYDKANAPTATSVAGAPAGVAVATTSGQLSGSTTATNNAANLTGDAAVFSGAGAGNAQASGIAHSHTQNAHTHSVDVLYQHGHTLSYTSTSLAPATAEATTLVVLYK